MEKRIKSRLIIKLIILIILIIILLICSFKTGEKFFVLKNTYFDTTSSRASSNIAKWYFSAKIIK